MEWKKLWAVIKVVAANAPVIIEAVQSLKPKDDVPKKG